ncbi:MAG: biosynthetic-type acetolactate synthase large subunit [Rhodospirillales bacterium]|jgi:acetolactate synthase-1/2/3 large subunit|nr:biosynthetic-type acetolactate synthase large subunit [Rhodospirillales bacterium]HIJ43481.1 biosynthetic-type acetolactate synthase large subunit [Rhodospirillaceae bacterium]HIJ93330.1 biosynthetic-type acetolactate synthase large subunit [Rhodospirillaceae bacterium]
MAKKKLTGAEIFLRALKDQGVEVVFGYPGGVTLSLYDEIYKQNRLRHVLTRHEQAAVHAAEGYARSTGKPGVVLVTSGPGATNTVTGLTDALMDSIPVVCITGQVPTALIGNDAFQEADTTGITRSCTKHNNLVKDVDDLARVLHEAFYIATHGRPGPVVVDLPKDVVNARGVYVGPDKVRIKSYQPRVKGDIGLIDRAVKLMAGAKRPIIYAGGGVINAGPAASARLERLVHATGFPCTLTLMGLGALPASDKHFLGMLGMHGTYEANLAMHHCDVMLNVGARFDDRVTGKLDGFAPEAKKIHVDIDPSSINKNVLVDIAIVGDAGLVLEDMIKAWKPTPAKDTALKSWWKKIDGWRARKCLSYGNNGKLAKPQYILQRLQAEIKDRDVYVTTDVGQHQMWTAQYIHFEKPNRLMTSGGLGTMGYGLPAAVGVQIAHPEALVIVVTSEGSLQMNLQELATISQYRLPIKILLLNNGYMGMVRQWQELFYGKRYSESRYQGDPDFVKLAEAYGAMGLQAERPDEVDGLIKKMLAHDGAVLANLPIDPTENVFPMIAAGACHHEMILGPKEPDLAETGEDVVLA